MNPSRTLAAWCAAVGMAVAVAPVSGAASALREPPRPSQTPPTDPLAALREASRKELEQPNRHMDVDPLPGMDAAALAPINVQSPEGIAAARPLERVLDELKARQGVEPAAAGQAPPRAVINQALRLYAQGREKIAAGSTADAVADLDQASKLFPDAPEIWRELGDAQTAAGRRLAANSSYMQACQRGIADARVWWLVGRDALRSRKLDQAGPILAKARGLIDAGTDPALEYIIEADLGECLLQSGSLSAGIEAVARGTSFPTPLPWSTRMRSEIIDLLRRRGDLRVNAGDAAARMGDALGAIDLYDHAAEDGQLDPAQILFRKAYALWSSGRPAAAAELLVEDMTTSPTPIGDGAIALIRRLKADPSVGLLLSDAILSASRVSQVKGDTAVRQWTRAVAAAENPQAARRTLRDALAKDPDAYKLFLDLLETLPRNEPRARVGELLELSARERRTIPLVTRLMVSSVDAEGELRELESRTSPEALVLRVRWLQAMGRVKDGAALSETLDGSPLGAYAVAARIEALAGAGEYERVVPLLAKLRAESPANDPLLVPWTLHACQRIAEAFDALPEASSDAAMRMSPSQKLAAAAVCLRAGKVEAAESYALRALDADPMDDSGYEVLAALYGPGSPLASEDKLGQTLRLLRQVAPDGAVVRWQTAQEMLERKMNPQALEILVSLVQNGSMSDTVLGGLATALERRVALGGDAAEQTLAQARGLVAVRPELPQAWLVLGRVMAAAGKGEDVEKELAARYASRPWPIVGTTREAILRDVLKKPDAARDLAFARLSPLPRPIEATVAYAAELYRAGDLSKAVRTLVDDLPRDTQLTTEQQTRLAAIIAGEYEPAAKQGESPKLRTAASGQSVAQLFEVLASHGAHFAPPMYDARITLLAGLEPPDIAGLRAACEQAARDIPTLAYATYARAAQELMSRQMQKEAVPFLRGALVSSKEPSDLLIRAYVVQLARYGTPDQVADLGTVIGGPAGERKFLLLIKSDEAPPTEDAALHAEFFYRTASIANLFERRDMAVAMLESLVAAYPDHAMACNDLGYYYLEDGVNHDRAEQLLAHAYKLNPQSVNVVDSFGWLRYQQGVLADSPDPKSGAPREGAVRILGNAAKLPDGQKNPTIQDHYADAAWRAGEKDAAVKAWRLAESTLTELLSSVRSQTKPENAAAAASQMEAIQKELAPISAKLKAVDAGKEPEVAPMKWAEGHR